MIPKLFIFLESKSGFGMSNLLPFLAMIVVLYFFMIRPQMKRQKNEKNFQNNLKKGKKVVTNSGIHGKIVEIKEGIVIIETGTGKITFEQSSISMELSKRYEK